MLFFLAFLLAAIFLCFEVFRFAGLAALAVFDARAGLARVGAGVRFGAAGRTADYKEGISAFQQKRPFKFIGR